MLEWIETFLVVYDTQNFTTAAERLFISQPTVSAHIKKLEAQLSLELFSRKTRQIITPTKEADYLYPKFLKMITDFNETISQVSEHQNGIEPCVIACSQTIAQNYLPPIMSQLFRQFPKTDFTLKVENSIDVVHLVETNQAHIGLFERPIKTSQLDKSILLEDELVIAGSPDANRWLLREDDSGTHFFNQLYLNEMGLSPRIIRINQNELLLNLLKQGIGQSLISKTSLKQSNIPWQSINHKYAKRSFFIVKNQAPLSGSDKPLIFKTIKHLMKTERKN